MSCDFCSDHEVQLTLYSIVSDMGPCRCPVCGSEIKNDILAEELKQLLNELKETKGEENK